MSESKKELLIKYFLQAFPGYNDGKWRMYCIALDDMTIEFLTKRFKECLLSFSMCPSVAEIVGTENQELAELERAWQIFLKTMCNNYSFDIIPDEVYTIKRMLGEDRCENITVDELHWLKKEFEKCYKALKSGMDPELLSPNDCYKKPTIPLYDRTLRPRPRSQNRSMPHLPKTFHPYIHPLPLRAGCHHLTQS